jgi:hypothetical protein
LQFPEWRAAVRLCCAFDFPENVQFGHRGNEYYAILLLPSSFFLRVRESGGMCLSIPTAIQNPSGPF